MPTPRPRITGAVSRVRMSPGPRSRIQRAPDSCTRVISCTQSTRRTRMASVSSRARATSRPTFSAQPPTISMPSASRGVWKPTSTCTGSNTGAKTSPPRSLFLRSASSFSEICRQYSSKRDNCSGVPVMTTERRPLRMDSTGGSTVRTSWANSSSSRLIRSGSALVTDTIGGRSPSTEMPRRRATSVPAAPISWASASSSTSRAPAPLSASTASTPWECPATATGGVAVRSMPWRASARTAAIWVSSTPGMETAAEVRCLLDGTGSSAASARTQDSGSKPIGRTTTSSFATGSSSRSTSPTRVASSGSMPADETSSSRVSSQALPWPPKATA
ncbi:hypothetical protein PICSAR65_03594 [Mycobacterium avium subsp. paratuberculosis]|nr:hypothetical protein PICSAR65_03594 [Mycobacterium avium subsp. paratuberculosis]